MNKHMREKPVELLVVFHLVWIKQHLKFKIRIVKRIQRNKHGNYNDANGDNLCHSSNSSSKIGILLV